MEKSVKAHGAAFRKHGTFFEKLNGETGGPPRNFQYASQKGFGWTNAAFYRYVHLLDAINEGVEIYKQPQPDEPPYGVSVIH